MTRYIMRLDDACPKRDIAKWDRMEALLDKYGIKPLVGVIPDCKDPDMDCYAEDIDFWTKRVLCWQVKGWQLALHGYNHVFKTNCGGINPVNNRSEFAGVPLEEQKQMISNGVSILRSHGINPKVFFAPAHTFDENTIKALLEVSDIRVISDTPANKPYSKYGITFVPQQSGRVRKLPFNSVTFCYHPNAMNEKNFDNLEKFLQQNQFVDFPIDGSARKISLVDKILMRIYYARH